MTEQIRKIYDEILELKIQKRKNSEIAKFISEKTGLKESQAKYWARVVDEAVIRNKKSKIIEEKDKITIESNVNNIKSLEDLIKTCDVDTDKWSATKFQLEKKDIVFNNDGVKEVHPQVFFKAILERNKKNEINELVTYLKEKLQTQISRNIRTNNISSGKYLYVLGINDLHLGKMCWGKESGKDYDSNIAVDLYKKAVIDLISHVDRKQIERILLPIGNDFFNVDNEINETTNGTLQHEDSRWQKSFKRGLDLLIEVIESLSLEFLVDVKIVPGNHDGTRSFYLGECLASWFRNNTNVAVDNSPKSRKYYKWEKNLIGLTHGNEEKISNLPSIMASECKEYWGETNTKLFLLGHFHHEKVIDENGVKIQFLPSLCPADAWHYNKGYVMSTKAAQGILISKANGIIANYYYNFLE